MQRLGNTGPDIDMFGSPVIPSWSHGSQALIVRATDTVQLIDDNLFGVDGATRILNHLDRQTRSLNASHNNLGRDGAVALVRGLSTTKALYSASSELWGLKEINLARNRIDDVALASLVWYASKDPWLHKLFLQSNRIKLGKDTVDHVVERINKSELQELSLSTNPLRPMSMIQFFNTLDAPRLRILHLSSCRISTAVAPAIASYLKSPRSRNLQNIQLHGNGLGRAGVQYIVNALKLDNFTLTHLGVFANSSRTVPSPDETDDDDSDADNNVVPLAYAYADDAESMADDLILDGGDLPNDLHSLTEIIENQLGPLLERNRHLTRRVRHAASRAIAPARIILRCRPPTDKETAQRVIEAIGSDRSLVHFPLLSLPDFLISQIMQHCSGDASALSSAQWTRLTKEAKSATALGKMIREMAVAADVGHPRSRLEVIDDVRDTWLRRGGWDKWDCDSAVSI